VTDFHIGVVSTSLGGHGADSCSSASAAFNPTQNDAGHFITRGGGGGVIPTYANAGFLAWDPGHALRPPGDSDLAMLTAKLTGIMEGIGTSGCGYEAPLESFYRFLVDPDPYQAISIVDGKAMPQGTDDVVLQQRSDFLRPDSALVIVMITDENDCSTREGGRYYLSNQTLYPDGSHYHLPRARSECARDLDDPCCSSCGSTPAAGCPPNEADSVCLVPMTDADDPVNLRCFDQKRRFGIDFLYPIDRYVAGLSEPRVATRDGTLVPNALYAKGRDPSLVLFAGIVGVPWQDVATDPKALSAGYRTATEIDWALLVGDPATGAAPTDPLMVESLAPRTGTNPVTGAALAPPDSPLALANEINGHERIVAGQDDLQYACIFPRPTPIDCAAADCECAGDNLSTNPICQGPDGTYSTLQRYARALPATRELRVLQGLGARAVVASICAPVVTGASQALFGYKPAVDAVLRSLRRRLIGGPEH
jgi:hypothetical protein